ncbi:P-loop containing nucleoside triphosphate hydrolase protein [Mrakia frigida]|uniref:P-loop containing nucleoside triphosphate hydrolase protein n=1 Tax=Mrakia frigida TaxID=29902 RepID=UPI003FCC1265
MTSITAFQSDIETIHDEKVAKQKEALKLQQQQQLEAKLKHGAGGGKKSAAPSSPVKSKIELNPPPPLDDKEEDDIVADLQTLLSLPPSPLVTSSIKAHLAPLLLRAHGELIVSLGQRRNSSKRFHAEGALSIEEIGVVGEVLALEGGAEGEKGGEEILEIVQARLKEAVAEMGGEISVLVSSSSPSPHTTLLVRLVPTSIEQIIEVRVACTGNVDSAKSTTLGVLTRGGLDDGRGKARINLFRHKHELESGRTSSVGMEILGFSPTGQPVIPSSHTSAAATEEGDSGAFVPASGTSARREKLSWDEICKRSSKVLSFIDLAGHERYLKTTIFGMTGCAPDYCILMVGSNQGLVGMAKEHLAVALALSVPLIVVLSKIDMTPPQVLEATKKQLYKILKSPGCRKTPVYVESNEDCVELAQDFVKERLCPIFCISNVTGEGLPLLRSFLNLLPTSQGGDKYEVDAPLEYSISDVFSVPFVGTVVNGVLNSGTVKTGDVVMLGPDSLGHFVSTSVKSIQRKRAPVSSAEAGQSVSFALKRVRRAAVRKGMVILAKTDESPKAVRRFEGQILVLYHNTTIAPKYQAVLHVGSIRQTVRIVSMDNPKGILRTGDRATVVFEFVGAPEFLKEGMKLLFREGKTKGLGVVTKVGI